MVRGERRSSRNHATCAARTSSESGTRRRLSLAHRQQRVPRVGQPPVSTSDAEALPCAAQVLLLPFAGGAVVLPAPAAGIQLLRHGLTPGNRAGTWLSLP